MSTFLSRRLDRQPDTEGCFSYDDSWSLEQGITHFSVSLEAALAINDLAMQVHAQPELSAQQYRHVCSKTTALLLAAGWKVRVTPGLESSSPVQRKRIALEGIGEVFRAIWRAIVNGLKWIGDKIYALFGGKKKEDNFLQAQHKNRQEFNTRLRDISNGFMRVDSQVYRALLQDRAAVTKFLQENPLVAKQFQEIPSTEISKTTSYAYEINASCFRLFGQLPQDDLRFFSTQLTKVREAVRASLGLYVQVYFGEGSPARSMLSVFATDVHDPLQSMQWQKENIEEIQSVKMALDAAKAAFDQAKPLVGKPHDILLGNVSVTRNLVNGTFYLPLKLEFVADGIDKPNIDQFYVKLKDIVGGNPVKTDEGKLQTSEVPLLKPSDVAVFFDEYIQALTAWDSMKNNLTEEYNNLSKVCDTVNNTQITNMAHADPNQIQNLTTVLGIVRTLIQPMLTCTLIMGRLVSSLEELQRILEQYKTVLAVIAAVEKVSSKTR